MTNPTPVWLEHQNLAIDLYDTVSPRISYEIRSKNDGLIRSVVKEAIQAGYRREDLSNIKGSIEGTLADELYDIILPKVSVWIQRNRDEGLRCIILQIIKVGYRSPLKDPTSKKAK